MQSYPIETVKRIVVGLDGSEGSGRALAWAISLARPVGAEIIAVYAANLMPTVPFAMGAGLAYTSDDWRKESQALLEGEWCQGLRTSAVRYRPVLEEGSPAPAIMEVARREGADMIVVGSRGFGGFTELLLGSVSHQLAHHSAIPVVIVPALRKAEHRQPAMAGARRLSLM